MTNSVEQSDLGPTLFACILRLVSNVRQLFAAENFSRGHFSDAFFLGALRVKIGMLQFNRMSFAY